MAIITLTTDWGLKDHYVASVKGVILSQCPDALIIDISHLVPSFNIAQAAFILKNCFRDFPSGTIHVVGVDNELEPASQSILIQSENYYFITQDVGIFSMISEQKPEKIFELQNNSNTTFPAKDILIKAACNLANGISPYDLGKEKSSIVERTMLRTAVDDSVIRGSVIYIDSHYNIITNISQELFEALRKNRSYTVFIKGGEYNVNQISQSYNDVPEGEMLALFNSMGLMEIAINKDKASTLLGFRISDTIRVEFYDSQNR